MKTLALSGSPKSTSASSSRSDDPIEDFLFPDYKDLTFIKKLSEAKFPVYLVISNKTKQQYAMKVFPWEDDTPSPFYYKEVRFAELSTPNIVSFVNYEFEQKHPSSSGFVKFSYILMEYAPYGDFFDVLLTHRVPFNETLLRTYFHQLVRGVEGLHSKGAAHLDLKLENLLLDAKFNLKITDFDLGFLKEEKVVTTRGTKNFRAPELLNGTCTNPQAADVYSMGIILFVLKTRGMIPYSEHTTPKALDLEAFGKVAPKQFWEKQCSLLQASSSFFSEDFKALFWWMTRPQPEERPTLGQIRKSRWYNREIYSEEELCAFMCDKFEMNE